MKKNQLNKSSKFFTNSNFPNISQYCECCINKESCNKDKKQACLKFKI